FETALAFVAALKEAMPEVELPLTNEGVRTANEPVGIPNDSVQTPNDSVRTPNDSLRAASEPHAPVDFQFWSPEPSRFQDVDPAGPPPPDIRPTEPPLRESEPEPDPEPTIAAVDLAEPMATPPAGLLTVADQPSALERSHSAMWPLAL